MSRREKIFIPARMSADSPDLLINFHSGFRVSWESSLGGFSPIQLFENNNRRWSGDHIIDPDAVPGILFMNRPVGNNHAQIIDLAPTILNTSASLPFVDGREIVCWLDPGSLLKT